MRENIRTFRFALTVTLACSLLLAGAATLLKPRQEANVKLDIKKNILSVVGIKPVEGESFSRQQIEELYKQNIKEMVVDDNGDIVEGMNPIEIDSDTQPNLHPLYEYIKDDEIQAYVIPISGKGLWSTLYGYFALETDLNTVKGITFYQHGETPGLGGEVEKGWFTVNFIGKKIFDQNDNLVSIGVVRGKVIDKISEDQRDFYVDGISGSTLTGRGLEQFLRRDLKTYEPFFRKERQKREEI